MNKFHLRKCARGHWHLEIPLGPTGLPFWLNDKPLTEVTVRTFEDALEALDDFRTAYRRCFELTPASGPH